MRFVVSNIVQVSVNKKMSQRKWVRPQYRTGSLYGSSSQGVDWPTQLFRQRPVLGLRRRARGTSTWAVLGDWTETNTALQLFYLQTSLKQLQCYSQIISKVWNKGFSTFIRSLVWTQVCNKELKRENTFLTRMTIWKKYYFASLKDFNLQTIQTLFTCYLKNIYNTLPGNIPAPTVHETQVAL